MKHVETWIEIDRKDIPLALILEDDAVFVSYFREKFDRTIYTAIRTGALKVNPSRCAFSNHTDAISNNEWLNQDPIFFIGSCMGLMDNAFHASEAHANPLLTTHKSCSSRCSHAYVVTNCSARALIRQINSVKSPFWPSDFILNNHVATSPTLQAFWLDPPIVYQGNMVRDLDGVPSFRHTTY